MGRRPNRSDNEPSSGEKPNCITAHTVPKMPNISAPLAVLPPMKLVISCGSTGAIIPIASMSSAMVTKMNVAAARRR